MNGLAKGVIGQVSADAVRVVGVAIDELKPRMHLEPLRKHVEQLDCPT